MDKKYNILNGLEIKQTSRFDTFTSINDVYYFGKYLGELKITVKNPHSHSAICFKNTITKCEKIVLLKTGDMLDHENHYINCHIEEYVKLKEWYAVLSFIDNFWEDLRLNICDLTTELYGCYTNECKLRKLYRLIKHKLNPYVLSICNSQNSEYLSDLLTFLTKNYIQKYIKCKIGQRSYSFDIVGENIVFFDIKNPHTEIKMETNYFIIPSKKINFLLKCDYKSLKFQKVLKPLIRKFLLQQKQEINV